MRRGHSIMAVSRRLGIARDTVRTGSAGTEAGVGTLDAKAHRGGIRRNADVVNALWPRWLAFNLLAPTYELTAWIATALDPAIALMADGHHAKADPRRVLSNPRFACLEALVIGEGEMRVAALLGDGHRRRELPKVM
nr:hypothetical protein KitaXyl93_04240 [Kitasatospora sp. Xyl93]